MKKIYIDTAKSSKNITNNIILTGICAFAIIITFAGVIIAKKYHTDTINEKTASKEENIKVVEALPEEHNVKKTDVEPPEEDLSLEGSSSETVMSDAQVKFIPPYEGKILCGYSPLVPVYSDTLEDWRVHNGIDIAAPLNGGVCAISDGTVENVYEDLRWGTTVVIDHGNDLKSIYSNLSVNVNVFTGEKIKKGDVIAVVGDTALFETVADTHLHFEMKSKDAWVNPLDYFSLK